MTCLDNDHQLLLMNKKETSGHQLSLEVQYHLWGSLAQNNKPECDSASRCNYLFAGKRDRRTCQKFHINKFSQFQTVGNYRTTDRLLWTNK